jgi:hypothetical protein
MAENPNFDNNKSGPGSDGNEDGEGLTDRGE